MALVSFSGTASTWAPAKNPRYGGGYARTKERLQPKDFSDGGDLYCYKHGTRSGRILEWPYLSATSMATLLTFLDSVNGGANTFQLNDYDSSTYTARVSNFQAFRYRRQDSAYYEVAIELEVISS